jgi:hypothetical protein
MSRGVCEGYDVDGFTRALGKVLRDRENHAVIDIGRQVERAIEHLVPSVFVSLGVTRYFPEARSSEISLSSVNTGPRCTKR